MPRASKIDSVGTDILREHRRRGESSPLVLLDEHEEPVGASVAPVRVYVVDANGELQLRETVSAVEFRNRGGGSKARYHHLMSMARGRAVSSNKRRLAGRPRAKHRWGAQA